MNSKPDNIPLRRHSLRHLEMYDVTGQELNSIERESLDVGQDFQFASNAFATAISFLVALLLTEIQSPKRYASFVAVVVIMAVLALYFGLRYFRKRGAVQSTIQEIRARQVGPVGEEGHELRPADLAALPVTPPPTIGLIAEEAAPKPAPASGEQK
jgi:hypothetical protein